MIATPTAGVVAPTWTAAPLRPVVPGRGSLSAVQAAEPVGYGQEHTAPGGAVDAGQEIPRTPDRQALSAGAWARGAALDRVRGPQVGCGSVEPALPRGRATGRTSLVVTRGALRPALRVATTGVPAGPSSPRFPRGARPPERDEARDRSTKNASGSNNLNGA